MLLDTPGLPGMSGSPVYFINDGFLAPRSDVQAFKEAKNGLDAILNLDPNLLKDRTVVLEFAGVYSVSLTDALFEKMGFGRFWGSYIVEGLFKNHKRGDIPPHFDAVV